jgi:hypothetical protein
MEHSLEQRSLNGGSVKCVLPDEFQLKLPALRNNKYALAQMDDYMGLSRRKFPHQPPIKLTLEAKVTATEHLGTWGFGFWNDPFSFGINREKLSVGLPVLPNAAWFFYASNQNHLSLRDDQVGSGFHVRTYHSPRFPSILSLLGLPVLPWMFWPVTARLIRRIARKLIKEDSQAVVVNVAEWHLYGLEWGHQAVTIMIDGEHIFSTQIVPHGKLGLVIWIDNQYFRFDPNGKIGYGFLRTQAENCLWVRNLKIHG